MKSALVVLIAAIAAATSQLMLHPASGAQVFVSNIGSLGTGTIGKYNSDGTTADAALVPGGLRFPSGVAVSGTDLFVVNAGSDTIGKYTTDGATVNAALFDVPNKSPYGIATSGGDLFVTFPFGGTIGKYSAATGATVNASLVTGLKSPTVNLTSEVGPYGIAVSGGLLFVTELGSSTNGSYNAGSGQVGVYDANTGAAVNASLIAGLNRPYAIAVSDGHIYVANFALGATTIRGTGTIGKYTLSGAPVDTSLISGLWAPIGIAVAGSDLFVTNAADNNSVGKYTTSGATVDARFFTGLPSPHAIAAVPEPSTFVLGILGGLFFPAMAFHFTLQKATSKAATGK